MTKTRKPHTRLALNQQELAVRLYKYGLSAEFLGKVFFITPVVIINLLKRRGVEIRRPTAKLNLIGCMFGRLTVIAALPRKNNRTWWQCQCSCDETVVFEVRGDYLTGNAMRSCGCMHAETKAEASQKMRVYDTYSERSARHIWGKEYRDGGLTFEQFYELSQKNCFYCGAAPSSISNPHKNDENSSQKAKDEGDFVYNGLDRMNNDYKHTLENVVPCCKICNLTKGIMNMEDFEKFIRAIHAHRIGT